MKYYITFTIILLVLYGFFAYIASERCYEQGGKYLFNAYTCVARDSIIQIK